MDFADLPSAINPFRRRNMDSSDHYLASLLDFELLAKALTGIRRKGHETSYASRSPRDLLGSDRQNMLQKTPPENF